MQEEKNTIQMFEEILITVNDAFSKMQENFDLLQNNFKSLETRFDSMETRFDSFKIEIKHEIIDEVRNLFKTEFKQDLVDEMKQEFRALETRVVSKGYLDARQANEGARLGRLVLDEDKKVNGVIEIIEEKNVIDEDESRTLKLMGPFNKKEQLSANKK